MTYSTAGLLHSRRWIEYFVLVAGIFCLATALRSIARYELFQNTTVVRAAPSALASPANPPTPTRLEIPRIKLSVLILEGDTQKNLALAPVHLTDTAPLGSPHGNAAIAGHRDSAFRKLANVRTGDEILVHANHDLFSYKVTRTRIVKANDTSALADDAQSKLTLITCYPFHYIGSAPQRFLVEATRTDVSR